MILTQKNKEIEWNVIIKNDAYAIKYIAEQLPIDDGPIRITRMYGLRKGVFNYVLSIFENGTYRLYGGTRKAKLYLKGPLSKLRFVPSLYMVSRTIH